MAQRKRWLIKDVVCILYVAGSVACIYTARRSAQKEMEASAALRASHAAYVRDVEARRLGDQEQLQRECEGAVKRANEECEKVAKEQKERCESATAAVESEVEAARARAAETTSEATTARLEVEELRVELETVRSELATARAERDSTGIELENARAERDAAAAACDDAKSSIVATKTEELDEARKASTAQLERCMGALEDGTQIRLELAKRTAELAEARKGCGVLARAATDLAETAVAVAEAPHDPPPQPALPLPESHDLVVDTPEALARLAVATAAREETAKLAAVEVDDDDQSTSSSSTRREEIPETTTKMMMMMMNKEPVDVVLPAPSS